MYVRVWLTKLSIRLENCFLRLSHQRFRIVVDRSSKSFTDTQFDIFKQFLTTIRAPCIPPLFAQGFVTDRKTRVHLFTKEKVMTFWNLIAFHMAAIQMREGWHHKDLLPTAISNATSIGYTTRKLVELCLGVPWIVDIIRHASMITRQETFRLFWLEKYLLFTVYII